MRRVWNKTQDEIVREWDSIAEMRSQQIRTGKDISYDYVLTPAIMQMANGCDTSAVLDVGCGCGLLTARLANNATRITGVDISAASICLARQHCHEYNNITFVEGAIEDLTAGGQRNQYSLAIANMSLMAMLKLDAALGSLSRLVRPGGHFVFTIAHPCFWPQYWNYSKEWFRYREECVIEAPFHISLDLSDKFVTTHIHRPLEQYVSELIGAGFSICHIIEPMPTPEIELKYPHPWEYPRFLAALCVRT
jgi:ubiquinone/menaquinone biosynthesis C-methylase UbiE